MLLCIHIKEGRPQKCISFGAEMGELWDGPGGGSFHHHRPATGKAVSCYVIKIELGGHFSTRQN